MGMTKRQSSIFLNSNYGREDPENPKAVARLKSNGRIVIKYDRTFNCAERMVMRLMTGLLIKNLKETDGPD